MTEQTTLAPVVRRAGEGERRWFFGGGVMTWKVNGVESGGVLSVIEVEMDGGKVTPMHTHPIAESLWVLTGRLRYRIEAEEFELGPGDFALVPAGVPHAFMVETGGARVIAIQPSGECEPFYLGASEPLEGSARQTDWERLQASAAANGGVDLLGPPPF